MTSAAIHDDIEAFAAALPRRHAAMPSHVSHTTPAQRSHWNASEKSSTSTASPSATSMT